MAESTVIQADAKRLPIADRSVDLVFTSPPYCDARTYGIGADRGCVEWVEWMLDVVAESQRVCRGPVVVNAAGVTRKRNYWPACEGLMWEWWKRGGECQLYRPAYWYRVGIPGSGGKDWLRSDVEYLMCFKRSGSLPWSDNTAMGHPPKWAPGGAMAHRLTDGTRVNQWGRPGSARGRRPNGDRKPQGSPSHVTATVKHMKTVRAASGDMQERFYTPPAKANPGNLIRIPVGGGRIGDRIAHENEAPFPEKLAEFFIRSFCPPGGTVLDPFSGSGTTAKVALSLGRNAIASDLRESQVELTKRRIATIQPDLFTAAV